MPLPRLEPGTSGKRWVSVANWATTVGLFLSFGIHDDCNLANSRKFPLIHCMFL
ncbi:hypothetical protein HanXRQr2_Chr10g0430631 [Helianthus annuus]|uniref:Uncharacterized protein n=1 Tax=Helianthus annuus TaxID=4232 RepID=A0A9K3N3C0_HELAN|nr:hypothetical protein HanXRQr2_Chr10g0430631 [Helianthus annuus]KAJ0520889.1 hypothetical protein HanIR_Chr10g0464421 [Helianthus annuus]